jgi:hypothetical protein
MNHSVPGHQTLLITSRAKQPPVVHFDHQEHFLVLVEAQVAVLLAQVMTNASDPSVDEI